MRKKRIPPIVFFNASVVLAGLKSPVGGSGKLLIWSTQKTIIGVISEIVFDEVLRNCHKIGLERNIAESWIKKVFSPIVGTPKGKIVDAYRKIVIDEGDAHVLASCCEIKAKFLVTLDKKHLLSLKRKIKKTAIVSPAELIEKLSPSKN